uniref:Uncharacterized protein n=1 Tax=Anguilla anguilla TaxID=7936 RepID=A0A0E9UK25_ANGAN
MSPQLIKLCSGHFLRTRLVNVLK